MRRRSASPVARLLADTRGAALVEFGFVAVPFAALMVAILQTSLVFFAQQTLETTAEKSVRQLLTGQAQKSSMSKDGFKTLVCSKLPSFMKCSNVLVDVQTAASFAAISTSAPAITFDSNGNVTNSFVYTPGGAGSINIVRIMYVWDVQGGPLGFDLSTMSNKKRLLYATSVFKTEPYT
ncbi:TadE/TadG family type IV pilus assembly protein [Sphingomonas sp. MMS12-HWE2-04]|uniref:TadE/TadG family type IV pilus assembly protein n=1 Tax=Sphingomonas sp. MMS12-HWE2-04 TaxID=3234199 RepID=UPI00384B9C67